MTSKSKDMMIQFRRKVGEQLLEEMMAEWQLFFSDCQLQAFYEAFQKAFLSI